MQAVRGSREGNRRRLGGCGLLLACVLIAGCARPMPPPGGPPDVTAPRILAVSPESLAVGVPIGAAITVIFSEPIDRTTIERALWVAPGGAVKPKFSFSGEELTVRLGAPLPDSVTVGVLLTTLVQDRKRDATQNAVAEPYRWIFSTGDTLWKGRVTGKVERGSGAPPGGGANRGIVLVGLYPGDADTVPDPSETEPAAITQMRANGEFTLDGLPTDGRRRWLLAMFDRDGNRAFNDRGDFVSATGEPIVLTPDSSATDVFLRLVDPNSRPRREAPWRAPIETAPRSGWRSTRPPPSRSPPPRPRSRLRAPAPSRCAACPRVRIASSRSATRTGTRGAIRKSHGSSTRARWSSRRRRSASWAPSMLRAAVPHPDHKEKPRCSKAFL